MATSNASNGVSFGGLLFLTFLVLKLTHVIAWSWWWIAAPLWAPFAIAAAFLAGAGVLGAVAWLTAKWMQR